MPPPFRNGETLIIEGQLQRDPYGDPIPGGVSTVVPGCACTPRMATRDLIAVRELTNYRDTVVMGLVAILPVGTEIGPYDTVVRSDGTRWQVVGEPARWYNPHLINGRNGSVEVALERVEGLMVVRIDWDEDGFNQVLRQPGMRSAIHEVAQLALQYAQAIAPIGRAIDGDDHPGLYKRSLKIENTTYIALRGPRPAKEVVADVEYSEPVEDRHHVIGRTLSMLAAAGMGTRRHRDD